MMPSISKVNYVFNSIEEMINTVNAETNLPVEFKIEQLFKVPNVEHHIKNVYSTLNGYRISPKYDYFRLSPQSSISRIQSLVPKSGFIYILSNPSMQGLLKIGHTTRLVEERIAELNNTGLPTPFKIAAKYEVWNPYEYEQEIHKGLATFRLSSNREFFEIDINQAKQFIESLLQIDPQSEDEESKDMLYKNSKWEEADKFYRGAFTFINSGNGSLGYEWMRKAARLGHEKAQAFINSKNTAN